MTSRTPSNAVELKAALFAELARDLPLGSQELIMLVQRRTVLALGRSSLPLLVVIAIGLVAGLRFGFGTKDYAFVIVGGVISLAAMLGYGFTRIFIAMGRPRRSWRMSLLALGGFIPYLYCCYLVFVRGVWGFIQLWNAPSWSGGALAFIFLATGYSALWHFWALTEEARAFDQVLSGRQPPT